MIKTLMERASKAYYDGDPFLTNEQYDALESIHGQIISGNGDIPHAYQMYSLNKHYGDLCDAPVDISICNSSPKLDGAAVSILYIDGEYIHALTRGDGVKGRDITEKLAYLGVPECIPRNGIVQLTGEVVAIKNIPNSRNYASGALNLKDMSEFYSRVDEGQMQFVVYNVQETKDRWGIADCYERDLLLAQEWGFTVVSDFDYDNYPTDGVVYRLAYSTQFNNAGFTSKFPKGAFAHKENQEAVVTKLLDVIWQTGKSGKVSPVGIVEEVVVGGAKINRATLNNFGFIEAMNLEIGCTVSIIRAGEIIPCITGRVYD